MVEKLQLADITVGGQIVQERLRRATADIERMPEARREEARDAVQYLLLSSVAGRSHLIEALVRHLGFISDPPVVLELFSGTNLSGPVALADTAEYFQINNLGDPYLGLETLPSGFLLELDALEQNELSRIGINSLADKRLYQPGTRLSAARIRSLNRLVGRLVPQLQFFSLDVEEVLREQDVEGWANLCLIPFWSHSVDLEVERFIKPGGFIVYLDLVSNLRGEEEAIHIPNGFVFRRKLTDSFLARLADPALPGYSELEFDITIMQRDRRRSSRLQLDLLSVNNLVED